MHCFSQLHLINFDTLFFYFHSIQNITKLGEGEFGGRGNRPSTKQVLLSLPVFKYKHFSVGCTPLVDFQSTEVVLSIFSCFLGKRIYQSSQLAMYKNHTLRSFNLNKQKYTLSSSFTEHYRLNVCDPQKFMFKSNPQRSCVCR